MKFLITGVHSTPAIALIDYLRQSSLKDKVEIVYVGRKYPIDGEKTVSLDFREISKRRIKFIPLEAGRLTRILSLRSLENFLKTPLGFFQALSILKNEKPDKILSFGGYIALPVAIIGFFLGIPVYTHEQTINPGLANKIISIFAKKVFCAFEENMKQFPVKKTVLTGNPIRQAVFRRTKNPCKFISQRPVIYITGGSLGSHGINLLIEGIIDSLLSKYNVIHQTGETEEYQDFERLKNFRDKLLTEKRNSYFLVKHFFDEEIGSIYNQADLVISRAGANSFFELLALQKPVVFIPLPWSAGEEQQKQAEIFQHYKIGEIFNQTKPSHELLQLLDRMIDKLDYYKRNFSKVNFFVKKNAAETIAKEIFVF